MGKSLSIAEILHGYKVGQFGPVEIANATIERVYKLDEKYKAWVCFDPEKLIEQARQIERRLNSGESIRALEGIPVGIKDIFNTLDFPTEMGSPLWKGFTPGNDARVVHQIKMAGGMIPGKTVTAEFAVHTLGKTLNPHDERMNPGTSSSGSAVAVALGMVPAALGTQTAGSIVRPASYCGVYGCKPSFGTIPRTGMLKTTDSLDTVGFFVNQLEDLERVWGVVTVSGKGYPKSYEAFEDQERQNKPANRPWRVAVGLTHTFKHAYPYAQEKFISWVNQLSNLKDIQVVDMELPSIMERAHEVHANIYNKSLSYYFKEEFTKSELVSPIMNDLINKGNQQSIESYRQALEEQTVMARQMDEAMQQYDVMVTLSTAGAAPLRDDVEHPDPALMWTMTYLPVVSAPVFVSPEGMPFGVQFVARRYNDPLLFKFINYLKQQDFLPKGPHPQKEWV